MTDSALRAPTAEELQRFEDRIIKSDSGCWLFGGVPLKSGYGRFAYDGKSRRAHRISWLFYRGEWPSDLQVCHRCDNRLCVNPDHLFLGTQQDNISDCVSKRRNAFGEKQHLSKLTPEKVIQIFALRKTGLPHRAIAARMPVSEQVIRSVLLGDIWKSLREEIISRGFRIEERWKFRNGRERQGAH